MKKWRQRTKAEKGYLSSDEIQAEIFKKNLDNIEKKLILLRKIQVEIIPKTIDIKATSLFRKSQDLTLNLTIQDLPLNFNAKLIKSSLPQNYLYFHQDRP